MQRRGIKIIPKKKKLNVWHRPVATLSLRQQSSSEVYAGNTSPSFSHIMFDGLAAKPVPGVPPGGESMFGSVWRLLFLPRLFFSALRDAPVFPPPILVESGGEQTVKKRPSRHKAFGSAPPPPPCPAGFAFAT